MCLFLTKDFVLSLLNSRESVPTAEGDEGCFTEILTGFLQRIETLLTTTDPRDPDNDQTDAVSTSNNTHMLLL